MREFGLCSSATNSSSPNLGGSMLEDAEPFRLWTYGQRQSLARDVLSHHFSLLPSTPCAVEKQTDAEKGTKYLHRSPTLMSFLFPLPSSHHTLLLPKSLTTPSPPPPSCLVFHIRPPSKTCPGHTHPHPSASVLAGNLDGRRSIRRPACGPPDSALGIFFGVQAFSASPIPHDARRIPSDVTPGARGPTQTTLTSATSCNIFPKPRRRGLPAAHHPCARH